MSNEIEVQFPFMVYHPAFPPETVNNQEELDAMVNKGWRVTPVPPSEEEMIKSKIKWHEDELETLYKNLETIERDKGKVKAQKDREKLEEAKVLVDKASGKSKPSGPPNMEDFVCSKCGKQLKTARGREFHEVSCKGVKV